MMTSRPPRKRYRRWLVLAVGLAIVGGLLAYLLLERKQLLAPYGFVEGPMEDVSRLGLISALRQPSTGTLNVLVIYAQFRDEAGQGERIPSAADRIFDPSLPGSFTHYYDEMSFGQLRVEGTVLPRRYTSDLPASAYLSASPTERGRYGDFAVDILKKVDADVDFGQFDNDGADGLPNSGDDDRAVDYVFLILRSVPRGFLLDRANGIAGIGRDLLRTDDPSVNGRSIAVLRKRYHGAILEEHSFAQTVGIMIHEFGHGLGLPDLYDVSYQEDPDQGPAAEGGGIGRWGLMGHGALGWRPDGSGGPSPMCAWSREQLGWVGRDNSLLREVPLPTPELQLTDLQDGGEMIKVYLEQESPDVLPEEREYLLLERLSRESSFYSRQLPADGVLVWHVRPAAMDNMDEHYKLVDLVCADGCFADAGYPVGRVPDEVNCGDNLDFYSKDAAYVAAHAGNLGDATDMFDGNRFGLFTARAPSWGSAGRDVTVRIENKAGHLMASLRDPASAATAVVAHPDDARPGPARLLPNYPNPFNPRTTIPYVLPAFADVQLVIYNSLGQVVRTFAEEQQLPGEHEIVWDSRDEAGVQVASGVYHCRLEVAGEHVQVRRMSLVR